MPHNKIKITQRPKYKEVVDGYDIIHTTTDGKEFKDSKRALLHQKEINEKERQLLVFKNVKSLKYDDLSFEFLDTPEWFYASNEEELEIIKERLGYTLDKKVADVTLNGYAPNENNQLSVGDWICCTYRYADCSRDSYHFYTFDFVRKEIERFLSKFSVLES